MVQTTRVIVYLNLASSGVYFTLLPVLVLNLLLNKLWVFHKFKEFFGNGSEEEEDPTYLIDTSTSATTSIISVGVLHAKPHLVQRQPTTENRTVPQGYIETRPTVKVGQYKLRRGPVHQGVKDSIPL